MRGAIGSGIAAPLRETRRLVVFVEPRRTWWGHESVGPDNLLDAVVRVHYVRLKQRYCVMFNKIV